MSEIVILEAELRDRAGKGAARATRRAGRVPAVIYGDKKEPIAISLDPKVLGRELNRGGFFGRLVDVKVDGATHRTLPRDVQFHPVTDVALHVDFVRVNASTRIHVRVPVVIDNQDKAPGVKRGGVVNIVSHDVELICAADSSAICSRCPVGEIAFTAIALISAYVDGSGTGVKFNTRSLPL